jgi:hypothetical protein
MRKRINRSPDLGDALALTCALKFNTVARRRDPYTLAHKWDPFKEPDIFESRSEEWRR